MTLKTMRNTTHTANGRLMHAEMNDMTEQEEYEMSLYYLWTEAKRMSIAWEHRIDDEMRKALDYLTSLLED